MRQHLKPSLLRVVQLFAIVIVCLLSVTPAHADPIVIVSGNVSLTTNTPPLKPAFVSLTGQNFSVNAVLVNGGFGLGVCGTTAGPCTSASLSWSGGGGDLTGTFTLNGIVFPSGLFNQVGLTFNSVTFTIPPEFFGASAIVITAPFTLTGVVFTRNPDQQAFLTGEGTVRVLLVHQTLGGLNGFFLDHADYVIGPQAPGLTIAPVPEPVTILLLATGLGGTALRLRFGRKRKR